MAMTSFASNIPIILDIIGAKNPKRLLDIGSGFGKFGLMARELLLSIRAIKNSDICPVDDLIVDCVEEAEYFYQQPYHDKIYNNHWHKDVFKMPIEQLNGYDLILLIDVVEHWDKGNAIEWLKKIKTNVLISTPKKVSYYKLKYYGSRKHVSQWTYEDFKGNGFRDDFSSSKSFILLRNKL